MITLHNDRLLRAIRHERVDATPIWLMRQAGRYLPEYRELRQRAGSFLQLCKTPELACLATLQPIQRFPLDAAILFSDILTIPDAMGLGLYFKEGEGPAFKCAIETEKDIKKLKIPEPEIELGYVLDTIRMVKKALARKIPLIGFCGSPWTIATYMIEGCANKSFPKIKMMVKNQPHWVHQLLDKLAEAIILHLNAQINAGADVVMLFDTWGGTLTRDYYQIYSLHYLEKIFSHIKNTPIILFTKGGGEWLDLMTKSGCHVIGVDWLVNLKEARKTIDAKVAIQGNLHPDILKQSPDSLRQEVKRILAEFGSGSGHIFNLGHGISPDASCEQVALLVDAVHSYSRPYHKE